MKTKNQMLQDSRAMMDLQDDILMDIDQGVGRLKNQALRMNEEAVSSTALLSDFDGHVDEASDALRSEIRHAKDVRETTGVMHLYVCVAILFLMLVLLLIFGFS